MFPADPRMHVVIPMAGHSRRFRQAGYSGPKALLQTGDRRMIEHVVGMFAENDIFHFIVNEEQMREVPDLERILTDICKSASITVVPSHELGPTHSVLQVTNIPDDAPIIISYCDFFVDWDYERFKQTVAGFDAAAPSFRGFHPASFGHTYYAYMRVDEAGRMQELREKRSFTEDRANEHASTGIYYFRSWSLFRIYAERLMARAQKELPEAYVSLILNELNADGLEILVPEVERFICLGTPEDFEQYVFWYEYFGLPGSKALDRPRGRERIGLIPMGGRGSRFREYGYRVSKPLIIVGDRQMVVRAAETMPFADRWIFAARGEDIDKHKIDATLQRAFHNAHIVRIDGETSGAAATCLAATAAVDPEAELTIASCDYECCYNPEAWQAILDDPSIDGAVWTFRLGSMLIKKAEAFAYCRVGEDGRTLAELVEKRTISDDPRRDPMVVGTFWYRRAADFRRGAEALIERDVRVNGEHYVGTSINQLIAAGKKFVIFDVEKWISFGDPFELNVYQYWEEHFRAARERAEGTIAHAIGVLEMPFK